jgi:hypothetical protein
MVPGRGVGVWKEGVGVFFFVAAKIRGIFTSPPEKAYDSSSREIGPKACTGGAWCKPVIDFIEVLSLLFPLP